MLPLISVALDMMSLLHSTRPMTKTEEMFDVGDVLPPDFLVSFCFYSPQRKSPHSHLQALKSPSSRLLRDKRKCVSVNKSASTIYIYSIGSKPIILHVPAVITTITIPMTSA